MQSQELLVMRFKELEHAGQTDSTFGDVQVAGLKQHELMEWYFAHQAERCAQSHASNLHRASFYYTNSVCCLRWPHVMPTLLGG